MLGALPHGWCHHTADWALLFFRLFSWVVLRVLNCLFLNVQLHKGHMKMVHKAAQAVSHPAVWRGLRWVNRGRLAGQSSVRLLVRPAPSAGGKAPLHLADLVSHGPVPTGLPLTPFMVLTTITSGHCLKSCRQLLSFWELCLEEELPSWALCPSVAHCTLRVEQAGMSLWLSPSRAHHSCSFPPISRSWMGSCCPSCCSPRAWVCSVWLGNPAPAPLSSGKKFCASRHTWVKSPAGALCIGMQLGVPAAAPTGPLPGLSALTQSSQLVQPMGSDDQLWFLGPACL